MNKKDKAKNPCEKYELAITDFVMGREMKMPKEELLEHLKTCKNCRRDLTDWQDTYTVMKTEAYYNTSEGKKKMKDSFEALKRKMAGVEKEIPKTLPPVIDTKWLVGSAAGKILDCLRKNGFVMAIPELRHKTGLVDYPFYEGIGWLDREKKVIVRGHNNQPEYVELRPEA